MKNRRWIVAGSSQTRRSARSAAQPGLASTSIVVPVAVSHAADWTVAGGTLALAFCTLLLAAATVWLGSQARTEARISRAALEAQVRPVLIDVPRGFAEQGQQELIHYER